MKMEDHFKETLNRAVANEPPVLGAWDRFEQRVGRGRRVRLLAAIATAAAVAVASVIVVPRLGTGDGIGLQAPPSPTPTAQSPTPTPTVDQYPGWATFPYDLYHLSVRHPDDWRVTFYEANPEIVAPGQNPGAGSGEATMSVEIALLDEEYDSPEIRSQGFDRSTRPDGRPFVWTERLSDGRTFIVYRFDWSSCLVTETPSCERTPQTLVVTIHIGSEALGDEYRETAEAIVTSLEYTGPQS